MRRTLSRRHVLAGLAASSATLGCGGAPQLRGQFPLGVAAGDATADGAVLWTYAPRLSELEVAVWRDDSDPTSARRWGVGLNDGFALTVASTLASGSWYRYRFEGGGERSEVGRFRTAPSADALEPLTFGATSCIRGGHDMSVLARASERADLDAVLFLGDSVYADGARSVGDYRGVWAKSLVEPPYRGLRAATSLVGVWDDHEVTNNWSADDVDRALRANAEQVFREHMPLRRHPDDPARLWRVLSWGRTADLFVLDSRGERDRAQGRYLSVEQLEWLLGGIRGSQAVFKLVLNSVPIGSFDSPFFAPFIGDTWMGFPAQRRELLQALDETGTTGLIFVSGDFHLASVGRVSREPPGDRFLEALVGPGAQFSNPSPSYPGPPQWDFSSAINNYATFELDPSARSARIRYYAGTGRSLFDQTYP